MRQILLLSLLATLCAADGWGQFVFNPPSDTLDTLENPPPGGILSPTVRSDDRELFFESVGVIYRVARTVTSQPFRDPVPLTEVVVPGFINERPFLSRDGLRLYFTRKATSSTTVREIFRASRPNLASPFNQIISVGPQSSQVFRGRIGSLSGDELKIYLEVPSPSKGITNDTDIAVSTRPSVGEPFGPWSILEEVSTGAVESDPQVTRDDRTLFFTRTNFGLTGAILSTNRDFLEDPFPPPVLVGGINAGNTNNQGPFVLDSGGRMYFSRNGMLVHSDRVLDGTYVLQTATAWIGEEFLLPVKVDTNEQDATHFEFSLFFNPNRLTYLGTRTNDRLGTVSLEAALDTPAILTVRYQSQAPLRGIGAPEEVIAIRFRVPGTVTPRTETVSFTGQAFLNGASLDDLPTTSISLVNPPTRRPSGLIRLW